VLDSCEGMQDDVDALVRRVNTVNEKVGHGR